MANLKQDIEKERIDIARTLKPHLGTQQVMDADSGEFHDQKRVSKNVVMTGTEAEFTISAKTAFTKPDSVHVTLNPESVVAMYGKMLSGNKFKIVAASALSKVKIKVLMRGY